MEAPASEEAGKMDPAQAARQRWMSVLAKAQLSELESAWKEMPQKPDFDWLRAPETGMVMLRARTGGTGSQFNIGQMTVTRCALRLANGSAGLGYVQGRSKRHAELAALFDALLQDGTQAADLEVKVITPLQAQQISRRKEASKKANSTKVNFFTLVRGEND
ncbi:phosphonate C-P lyase system protein PhnG [Pelagibius litoralis]|uniref:Phosphonate C-P lyase system protein PhnG n=1 Tax=Pelagibius litoralis TaxID=374515 RepID=A0A967F2I1_9PROT|nr:phosphonate C-P lyase system protein PhnG [Pelagibius litoralis]NIA71807.1 phosphonate C-P lyase system protein PhnG [Pelagibius litoralis]